MTVEYPEEGQSPWGEQLKAYVDASVEIAEAAADAAEEAAEAAAESAAGFLQEDGLFGITPRNIRVRLTTGSDFVHTLVLVGGMTVFPETATLSLVFDDLDTWGADLEGGQADWAVPLATADTIPDRHPVSLVYSCGGSALVWGRGKVLRV